MKLSGSCEPLLHVESCEPLLHVEKSGFPVSGLCFYYDYSLMQNEISRDSLANCILRPLSNANSLMGPEKTDTSGDLSVNLSHVACLAYLIMMISYYSKQNFVHSGDPSAKTPIVKCPTFSTIMISY
jgi:hypothetical protein